MRHLSFILGIALLCAFSILPLTRAEAQFVSDPLSFRVTPEAPAPGEETLITLTIFPPLDPTSSTVSWRLNGNPIESGANKTTFTFTMGPSGRDTVIGVTVSAPGGFSISRSLTFRPGSVNLVWEAQTYTPPFYGGRASYTPGAAVTVAAFPSVSGLTNNSLIFSWERDGEPVLEASGRGKSVFTFRGNQIHEGETVGVKITRLDGSLAAQGEVVIPAREPFILFYEQDPLRGARYERALTSQTRLASQEATLVAEPYFFSVSTREGSELEYSWTLNGTPISTQNPLPGLITLRNESTSEGSAVVGLQVQNLIPSRALQGAQAALELLFGARGTTFFGITL